MTETPTATWRQKEDGSYEPTPRTPFRQTDSASILTYTPVLSGTGWALGNGTLTGEYIRSGPMGYFYIVLQFGSTTTLGTTVVPQFTLPPNWVVRPGSPYKGVTTGVVFRSGVNDAIARGGLIGTNQVYMSGVASTTGQGALFSSTYAGFTGLGSTGDQFHLSGYIPLT